MDEWDTRILEDAVGEAMSKLIPDHIRAKIEAIKAEREPKTPPQEDINE